MSKMHWFRMYNDFLNDPKMIVLAFEDQRHFIGLLALKSDGVLDQVCEPALLDRIVAQKLWLDLATITDVKKRLIDGGLIDSDWQPIAWDKRQFKSDSDPSGADRQRRYRENKKRNASRYATVTPPDTDTDTDTDKEKKQKKKAVAFIRPSEDDLKNYAMEAKLNIDGMYDFYQSNGWKVGRNSMKDWKATARNWSARQTKGYGNATHKQNNRQDRQSAYLDELANA